MRLVAVTARHSLVVHTTLGERAVDVHFIPDLAVDEIQSVFEGQGDVFVEQRLSGSAAIGHLDPA
jgi:hypothetical protein